MTPNLCGRPRTSPNPAGSPFFFRYLGSRGAALAVVALLGLAGPSAAAPGDPAAGAAVYDRCLACHALAYNRTGPKHCGLIGRRAGSVPGFAYSPAMTASGIVWSPETLDRFLADPLGIVPGTSMTYDGVKDPQARADLIAFLVQTSASGETCP